MKVILVRHGDKLKEAGDVVLSDQGRKEAQLTAQHLKKYKITCLLSGTQKRAIQTTQVIGSELDLSFHTDSRLNERINFGDVPNQSYREYVALCSRSVLNRNYILPNGETSISAGNRVGRAVETVLNKTSGVAVFVSHGGVIGDYLRNVFSVDELMRVSPIFLKYYMVPCCSLTEIDAKESDMTLLTVGSVAHLIHP